MDFVALQAALLALVQRLVVPELEAKRVQWLEEPRKQIPGARVFLNITSSSGLGVDDVRTTEGVTVGGELERTVQGLRLFTLSLQCETESQAPAGAARSTVERLRTRLRRPSTLAALKGAGLALVRLEATQTLDYDWHDRRMSRAAMDAIFATTSNDGTLPADAVTYIERVLVTSSITAPSGALAPAGLQLVDQEIP